MDREYDCEPEYARECDDCEEIFTHPYFAYNCHTKYDSRIHRVCNTCFCENSTFCLECKILNTDPPFCECNYGNWLKTLENGIKYCSKCRDECESCENDVYCTKCKLNNSLATKEGCLCKPGFYLETSQSSSSCIQCSDGCLICNSSQNCSQCKSGSMVKI